MANNESEFGPWTLRERERDSRISAVKRLQNTVRNLTRARRRQFLLEYAWSGIFCGLLVAAITVLLLRLDLLTLSYSLPAIVAAVLASTLLLSLIIAWQRAPDELQVAIQADLQLNLKQKLSTAWEFEQLQMAPAVTESLAAQVLKTRLPVRAEHIFPPRINLWGKLTPVAAVFLLLLTVVDLPESGESIAPQLDRLVVEQGTQLRDYGRRMEILAKREGLPLSQQQSQQMQRLGNRMESGHLSRGEALNRLRQLSASTEQQQRAVLSLNQDSETAIDPEQLETVSVPSARTSTSTLQMNLEDLAEGRLSSSQIQLSSDDEAALSQHGISMQDLQQALDNLDAGDDQELREILDTLKRSQQQKNLRDAEELDNARRKLQQVRKNLGDSSVSSGAEGNSGEAVPNPGDWSGEEGFSDGASGQFNDFSEASEQSNPGHSSGYGEQTGSAQTSAFRPQSETGGAVLKPQSQIREGQVFTSEVRTLPRLGQPTLDVLELDQQYRTQVEAALSKQDYPLHQKELIRRYFLTLSEGDTAAVAESE